MKRLKRFRMLMICFLVGHSIDPMETGEYGYECFRCGKIFAGPAEPRNDLWFWLALYDFRGKFLGWPRRLREWWRCPECGRTACDRPIDADHLPF